MSREEAAGAVDFAYLEGIVAGDRALAEEILAIFLQQAELWAPKLADGAPDWRETVHTIKGAGRGVGARVLGDACERAEADGALGPVRAALDEAVAAIAAYRAA